MKNQASEMYKNGQYELAIQNFLKCLEIDEYNQIFNSTIYFNIAVTQDKMGKKLDSINSLN